MTTDSVDDDKRRFIATAATTAVGVVGAGFVAVPFIKSMQPSEKAKAAGAPVETDISDVEPGKYKVVEWRGKPVWVLRRTKAMLASLSSNDASLRDPESKESDQPSYAQNEYRSIKPEYLVVIGICTHLGCSPTYRPDIAPEDLGPDWKGGYLCPCHGGRYDLAGRVFKDVPPPKNLPIPPHRYLSDTRLLIGADEGVA